jgi:6-phosphogluconolactonase
VTDTVIFCDSPEEVAEAAAELIFEKQTEAVADRGVFRIALSGGSTPKSLYEFLASEPYRDEMSWEHWEVYWSDERAVPSNHPDSNYHLAHTTLLSKVTLRKIFPMISPPFTGGQGGGGELEQAAINYAHLLEQNFNQSPPVFDLILLGLGSDGHTASLLPHHPALDSQELVEVVALDSSLIPHPSSLSAHPSSLPRLTLTYRVLNAARTILFLITGEEKAEAVQRILEHGDPSLPATHVKPEHGECFWILDEAAAHRLT